MPKPDISKELAERKELLEDMRVIGLKLDTLLGYIQNDGKLTEAKCKSIIDIVGKWRDKAWDQTP